MPDARPVTLKDIASFFGMTIAEFTKEWKKISLQEKAQLRAGIENGTFSY